MTCRRRAAVVGVAMTLAGCDKVYLARVDVGSHAPSQVAVSTLSPAERDRAVSTFLTTATELGLRCSPSEYSIISDSYDPSLYELTSCQAEGQFTRVQLAAASDHVTVEVHQIGGMSEPAFFKRCRTRFAEALQVALPSGRVRVQYPYHWGRKATSPAA
jgi:hypothetical protein